jgi:uncharacterized protein
LRWWFAGQYRPGNAVEMTGIVSTEFTEKVNLRHFFVPLEVFPRTMTATLRGSVGDDNPVRQLFRPELTEIAKCWKSGHPTSRTKNRAKSMTLSLVVTAIGIFLASVLRGFTGFGFGLAAVPMLTLALPPAEVVPLVVTLQVIIGAGGLRAAWRECDWRSVGLLFPGLVTGVPIGLLILTEVPANLVRVAIGGVIAFSVWLIQRGMRLPPNPSRLVSYAVGVVSGVISGLASMGGPPVIVYLMAVGHSASRIRATSIVYFMLAGCVSFVPMAIRGLITRDILIWAAVSLPVLFGGSRLGTWGFFRAKPRHHRMVALVTLTILAVLLIGRSLID